MIGKAPEKKISLISPKNPFRNMDNPAFDKAYGIRSARKRIDRIINDTSNDSIVPLALEFDTHYGDFAPSLSQSNEAIMIGVVDNVHEDVQPSAPRYSGRS